MDKIHHIAIQVDNIETAIAWYCDHFDVQPAYQDDSWALLKFANISLALVMPQQHPPHFAIENTDADKFGELVTHRDKTQSIYIHDPFGNVLEVMKKES